MCAQTGMGRIRSKHGPCLDEMRACAAAGNTKWTGCVNTEKTTAGDAEQRKEDWRCSKTWRKCQDDTHYLIQLINADKCSVQ